MSRNKNKSAIIRMFASIAVLISICGLAVGSVLPAQAQPTMDTGIANFETDATNPSMLIQTKTTEPRVSLSMNEDFSNPFGLLKDYPQPDKSSGLPGFHAGYGQYFSPKNRDHLSPSPIEEPSRLYLKVSFAF